MNSYDCGDLVVLEAAFSIDDVAVTVSAPGALLAATSIPVEPLTGGISSGTVLSFDTPATATLTAPANLGAISLSVSALAAPLLAGDQATFPGGPTDPTDVSFRIQAPGQEVVTYEYGVDVELIRTSVGLYAVAWLIADAYTHQYRFIGTGEVQQEEAGKFYARPRNV